MNDHVSLEDMCRALSISSATGRNWVRLKKIVPDLYEDGNPLFLTDNIRSIKKKLQSGEDKSLKSRRNKKYISGRGMYNSYIPDDLPNAMMTENLVRAVFSYPGSVMDDRMLSAVICCAAIQMILSSENRNIAADAGKTLTDYLDNELTLGGYEHLIDPLIGDKEYLREAISRYPGMFDLRFTYVDREDLLGSIYISLKSINNMKKTGSYYTPVSLVKKMIHQLFAFDSWRPGKMICDPCCGTGNFLLQMPDDIPFDSIYGYDTDPMGIKIARINLALRYRTKDAKEVCRHILHKDYLTCNDKKFDYIVGNPPWGYSFTETEIEYLRKNYRSAVNKSVESYDVFIEHSLKSTKENGVVSFVLPESVINVRTHRDIREFIIKNSSIQYLEYVGDIFDKVQCPCIILQLRQCHDKFSTSGTVVSDGTRKYKIMTDRHFTSESLDLRASDDEYAVIKKIEALPDRIYLKNNALFAMGIVTGNNKKYLLAPECGIGEMILRGNDIYKYGYSIPKDRIVYDPEKFQQSAPESCYRAPEKLVYRFICDRPVFAYDDKQMLTLNSCNILIPKIGGMKIKYIMAVLDSEVVQFYYSKRFNSVKILRSHLEQIPLPVISTEKQDQIISEVDRLFSSKHTKEEAVGLCDMIDRYVADAYGLTDNEYKIVSDSSGKGNPFLK